MLGRWDSRELDVRERRWKEVEDEYKGKSTTWRQNRADDEASSSQKGSAYVTRSHFAQRSPEQTAAVRARLGEAAEAYR